MAAIYCLLATIRETVFYTTWILLYLAVWRHGFTTPLIRE